MELTLTRPDDWHLHVRDADVLSSVVPHTARQFARAIIMPNLTPPVADAAQALAYRERILAALPTGMTFEPLMTLYLTDNTSPEEILKAKQTINELLSKHTGLTPEKIADSCSKCRSVTVARMRASVVLPQPGGPHRIIEPSRPPSIIRRNGASSASR